MTLIMRSGSPRMAKAARKPLSIGLIGNAADIFPDLLHRDFEIDIVTDQTSAHDPLNGYVPAGYSLDDARELRERDPAGYIKASRDSMAKHVCAMVDFGRQGAEVFDYGNNLRADAKLEWRLTRTRTSIEGFVPAYIRPLFCLGKGLGPFRWVALSGDPADIYRTD